MERLARMVQQSLDRARLSVSPIAQYGVGIQGYRRYGYRTVFSDRPYGHYGLALPPGDSGARLAAQAGLSECNGRRRGGGGEDEQGREQGTTASYLFHAEPTDSLFFPFFVAIAPGLGPFRAALVRRPTLRNTPQLPVDGPTLFELS